MFIFRAHARLAALEERCETLERKLREAVADVNDAWERTARLHGRIAKRAKLADDLPPPMPEQPGAIGLARALARRGAPLMPGRRTNGGNDGEGGA